MVNFNRKKILDCIIILPFLWVFTGLFLYPDGKKLIVILILFSAITSIFSYGKNLVWQNIKTNKLLWILAACSLFSVIAKTYYGYSSSLVRALICLFILLATFPATLTSKINIKVLIITGTITSFVYVMFETYVLGHWRTWSINPIPYATFSASLSIAAFYYLLQSKSWKSCLIWLSTFIAAVLPLIYSQSRGLWLALAATVIVVIIKLLFSNKKSIYLLLPFILASSAVYYVNQDKITQRIERTKIEIEQISQGNLNTSIGLRLQMWKAAIILAKESPLIGLGNRHIERKKELVEQKLISSRIVHFSHYHNQFLSDFIKYGIIGFALLLISILLPVYYLAKNKNENTWPGLLIILIFIIGSLTDVPFQHAQTLIFYFVLMYLLLSKTCKENKKITTASDKNPAN